MAFDKEEMKQLESLFNKFEEKIDRKMDQKLSVQRFEISKDTKSIIDAKLKPIHEKLDRFFEMESEDTSELYTQMEQLQKRVIVAEKKLGIVV